MTYTDLNAIIAQYQETDLPGVDAILAAARKTIEAAPSWPTGKKYGQVQSHSLKAPKGPGWHARISEHSSDEATFDQFWEGLGVNHAQNESEWVEPSS